MRISRTIAFVLCSCVLSSAASAQSVLHAIWVSDPSEGVQSTASFSLTIASLSLSGDIPESQLKNYYLNSKTFSPDDILNVIDTCPATQEDCMLFFYCGHGFMSSRRQPYILPNGNRKYPLFLKDILIHLKRKKPRQAIAIFDCCQTIRTGGPAAPAPAGSPSAVSPLAQSLFFEERSATPYCVISSAPGESALGAHMVKGVLFEGALFSMAFAEVVGANSSHSLTWDEIFKKVQANVDQGFSEVKQSGVPLPGTLVKQPRQTVTRYTPLELLH